MSLNADGQTLVRPSLMPIFTLTGIGPVPSFKNNKMLTRGKLITDPKKQQWMERAIHALEFQFISLCPTTDAVTLMAWLRQSLTALLPPDDAWQFVPEIHLSIERVKKGQEGCRIHIERL